MPSPPYDTVEMVLQSARVRLNDAIQSINGDILTDLAAFTPQVVNNAWRRLQEYLADRGCAALNRETILPAVPAWGSADPGKFVSFNWATYSDGVNLWAVPVLPQDMIAPLDFYERVTGSNAIFTPMDQVFNGLPTANPAGGVAARDSLNRLWEWRQETIYMPGASGTTDIRMRYAGYLADFVYVAPPGGPGWSVPVSIMRSLSSFAWYVCSEMARARGDMDAGQFDQYAMEGAEQIWNRDYREGRRLYKRAELGKMADPRSKTAGANSPNIPNPPQLLPAGGNG